MTETSGVFCVLGPDEHRDQRRAYLRASAGRPLPGNEVRVVGPATGTDVTPGEVGGLAHYKCPTSVSMVPALPRNPTGKVLKRQLRSSFIRRTGASAWLRSGVHQ
jgi:acyl-CoA synthetase (AMP-forming)/AMP-acid ligase II